MDAATVWRLWRRILREPRLREEMFCGDLAAAAPVLGLTADEVRIARAYAWAGHRTRFAVASYRYRMTSSFRHALETAAPLTGRALAANCLATDELAIEFFDRVQWRDFGPFVFTFGAEILDFLAGRPAVRRIAGLPELMRIERAGIDVVTGAARNGEAGRPWLEVVRCPVDVSGWLRDPSALGRTPPQPRPRHFVVYLPDLSSQRRIVAVSRRAADILAALEPAQTEASLAAALAAAGHREDRETDRAILGHLGRLGLLAGPAERG